jgi:hypothetical protein
MPRKYLRRILPSAAMVKENRYLKVLGSAINNPDCWYLNKHSVAGAFFIGLFCAFLPMPFQTVLAGFLAIFFKRNLPLSVGLVFITNPVTMPPIFYFNYLVGSFFFPETVAFDYTIIDNLWGYFLDNFNRIGRPLIVGSIICGLVAGMLGFIAIHIFWRWQVSSNWVKRQKERSAQRKLNRQHARNQELEQKLERERMQELQLEEKLKQGLELEQKLELELEQKREPEQKQETT